MHKLEDAKLQQQIFAIYIKSVKKIFKTVIIIMPPTWS